MNHIRRASCTHTCFWFIAEVVSNTLQRSLLDTAKAMCSGTSDSIPALERSLRKTRRRLRATPWQQLDMFPDT